LQFELEKYKKLRYRYRFHNYNYASILDNIIQDKIFLLSFEKVIIYEDAANSFGYEYHNYNLSSSIFYLSIYIYLLSTIIYLHMYIAVLQKQKI